MAADSRLETAAMALRALRDRPVGDPTMSDAEDLLAMHDAIRVPTMAQFETLQRQLIKLQAQVIAFQDRIVRKEASLDEQQAQNAGSSGALNERAVCDGLFEGAPATPVGADPPWLDEAALAARQAWNGHDCKLTEPLVRNWRRAVRAVLAFAAAKARAGG